MDAEMQKELKEAIDGIGRAHAEFKTVIEEKNNEIKKLGESTGETKEKLDKINEELNNLGEMKTRLDRIEAAARRSGGTKSEELTKEVSEYKKALVDGYIRKGLHEAELVNLHSKAAEVCPEMKALRSNSNPDGGYWVTPDTGGRQVQKIFETSPIRPVASVQSINTDALIGSTDYGEADAGWEEDQQTAGDETDTPQVGQWRIPAHTMYARPKIPAQLLEDASIDPEAWLMNKVTRKFIRKENAAFVNGNGAAKPRGFLTYTAGTDITAQQIEQVTTAVSGVLDDTDIVRLIYSLKSEYRMNAAFAMSRTTISTVRQIQDDQGSFVWQPGLIAGEPDRLAGYPVLEMNDIPDSAAGALAMAFADWAEFYQIVDRVGMSVLRDPYSSKPQVELYVRRRVGGAVLNFEGGKVLKIKA